MRCYDQESRAADDRPQSRALLTLETTIQKDWIDYNGHATEWQYYKVLSDAMENFLRAVGFSEEYRGEGYSFFAVEGHLRNLRECRTSSPLRAYSELLGFDRVRLHVYQYIVDVDRDIVVATGEHMLLHVNTHARRAVALTPYMEECLQAASRKCPALVRPRGMTRSIVEVGD